MSKAVIIPKANMNVIWIDFVRQRAMNIRRRLAGVHMVGVGGLGWFNSRCRYYSTMADHAISSANA